MALSSEILNQLRAIPAHIRYLATLRSIRSKLPEPYKFTDEEWAVYSWDWDRAIKDLDAAIADSAKAQSQMLQQIREAVDEAYRSGKITSSQLQELRQNGLAGLGVLPIAAWIAVVTVISAAAAYAIVNVARNLAESNARAAAAATIASSIAARIRAGQSVPSVPSFDEFMTGGGGSPIDKAAEAAGTAVGGIAAIAGVAALIWFWRK